MVIDSFGLVTPDEGINQKLYQVVTHITDYFMVTSFSNTVYNTESISNLDLVSFRVGMTIEHYDYEIIVIPLDSKYNRYIVTITTLQSEHKTRAFALCYSEIKYTLNNRLKACIKHLDPDVKLRKYPWRYYDK